MRMARMPVVRSWLLLSTVGLHVAGADEVAIIYGLTGQAFVKTGSAAERRPAQRFEWLPAEAEIEVGEGATLLLAFASGTRYELRGGSKAALSASGAFRSSSGPVKALASVSPLPRLESFAADTRQGGRAGALRIRGSRIDGLYPRDPASVLPHESILLFEPLPGTLRYKVQVEDEVGNAVFDAEVSAASVVVSPGVLKPGGRYHWTVRSLGGAPSARGEADFSVLSAESLAAREELRRSLEGLADPASLALLAEVDSRLGLFLEAQRGFRAAIAKSPADATLQTALEKIERQIASPDRDARP